MSKPIPINTKTKLITNYSSESCSSERYDAYKGMNSRILFAFDRLLTDLDPYEEEYEEYGDYGTPPTDYKVSYF